MDVEYLREYLTVASELSFTRAARLLNSTQSTLSKHIAALEREFGSELLHRGGKSIELTGAGAALFRSARTIVTEYDSAKAELARLSRATIVRVGGMLQNGEVIDILSKTTALLREPGHSDVHFATVAGDAPFERLAKGEADVVIYHEVHDGSCDALLRRRLLSSPFVLVVERDHPLAGRSSVRIADLADYPLVQLVGEYASAGWDHIRTLCEGCGFAPRKYPIVVSTSLDFLTESLGDAALVISRSFFVGGAQPYSGLRVIPFDDPQAGFEFYAYLHPQDERRLAGFLDLLEQAAAQVQASEDRQGQAVPTRPFQRRCRALAGTYGLNESETEAMIGFAKGRSIDRISQEMGLTRLMVGDLLASVYQKVGVRDKQDLLDAIEATPLG